MRTHIVKILYFSVIITGFTSIITQILFLRSFLEMFYGNELVIGIVLCNWMLLTGLGSYLGKFPKFKLQTTNFKLIIVLQILISLIPLLSLFTIINLKNILFPVGSMVSLTPIFVSSFIVLLPYCLLSGFILTLLSLIISELTANNKIGKVYGLDVTGSIVGGIIFNAILIFYFKTFQSLILLMLINLIFALIFALFLKKRLLTFITSIIFISAMIATLKYNPDYIAKQLLYKGQNVILIKDTPYGNLVITKTEEQINFYENGVFLFSTQNLTEKEEDVHYAMLQHAAPKNVLLVSGGISGTTDEILKYNVDRIDYVEINPYLVKIAKEYNKNLDNPKINIINKDAVLFLQTTINEQLSTKYDVALINVPPPTTAQLNRFYTIEFFNNLKKHLNKDGVISIRLMPTEDYVNKEAKQVNSVLFNTLSRVFRNVLIIPGGKNYFIASDKKVDINIAHLCTLRTVENKQLATNYVNQYYIDDELLKQRSDFIMNSLDKQAPINKDFAPVAYYEQLQYWFSYFSLKFKVQSLKLIFVLVIVCLIILFLAFRIHNPAFGIHLSLFTTGFTASSVEFLLLVYFQVMYGFVYQMTGILIMLFMFGIAAGVYLSMLNAKGLMLNIKNYILLIIGLAAYTIAIPFVLILLRKYNINPTFIEFVFFFIIIDIGTLTGMIFSRAVSMQNSSIQNIAAKSIGADMLGSALGVLLVSAFLLPLLGLIKVSILIGGLNILSGLVLIIKSKGSKNYTNPTL